MTTTSYDALEDHFARLNDIGNAMGVLHWDRATMMPNR